MRDILSAEKIVVAAAGRSAAAMRAAVIRLRHLGLDAYFVGEASTPPVGPGDLLIVGSGSGRTQSVLAQAEKAKQAGAGLLLFTIDPASPLAELADTVVVIPAPSPKVEGEATSRTSIQPMGSLFEQCLLVLLDTLVILLMQKLDMSSNEMFKRHANLE
jgi:6-phospho-3-hexuloisomerase